MKPNRPRKQRRPRRLEKKLRRHLNVRPQPQPRRQCKSKAVCITRIAKPRAMLGPHLYIEGILGIEVNLIETVMESPVSGVRRSTTSRS